MKQLQIITCVKQVPDLEGPAAVSFKIDSEVKKVNAVGIPPVLALLMRMPWRRHYVFKDTHAAKVIMLNIGEQLAHPPLKRTLPSFIFSMRWGDFCQSLGFF